jgi:hypothetical protein
MARGTPTYFSGTVAGDNQVQDFYTALKTRIEAYQSNSTDAWEEYDPISTSAGSRDYVFRSLGDRTLASGAGDAALFLRMTETATYIDFRGYQDWSTNGSGSGAREAFSLSYCRLTLNSTDTIAYWGVSNEYEFSLVLIQGGTHAFVSFGSPQRTHVPSDGNGICLLSSGASAGSSVVLSVDRDVSSDVGSGKLTVGQKVWVYNLTATGDALETSTVEIVEVEAVTSNTVTVDSLASNKAAGAIVGLDPCPMGVATYTTGDPPHYYTNHKDGSWASALGQVYYVESIMDIMTEGNIDPAPNSLYYGGLGMPHSTTAGKGGPRGTKETLSFWSIGTQADQQRMLTNYAGSAAGGWKIFPSLANNGYALAIGPGASS